MEEYIKNLPGPLDFFPPTPRAAELLLNMYRLFPVFCLAQWTPIKKIFAQGKTSTISKFNLPGRFAWAAAEIVGPLNLIYIFLTLPSKLRPVPSSDTSFLRTGLPAQCEIMGLLYIAHYINRAIITPLFFAPSMSPIHAGIMTGMMTHQFINSSNIACWLIYSTMRDEGVPTGLGSPFVALGLMIFLRGLRGNIGAEHALFDLRRGAAQRKAKSEGKAVVTYDKVYVIPPAEGWFKDCLYPHYVMEWMEWIGYYIMGGFWGFGWGYDSAALWFIIGEVGTMLPRAYQGKQWYEQKFGKRAIAGRAAALPILGL